MKYPFIIFYRYDKYKDIDLFFDKNANLLDCTIYIVNKKEKLNKLYKQIYPLLVTYGDTEDEYKQDLDEFIKHNTVNRLLHISNIQCINHFNILLTEEFINMCSLERIHTRPEFSIFTTSFNSYKKILRAFNSIQKQTYTNWEWVIIDDSPDYNNFNYLKNKLSKDSRIRLYKRFENNSYIGNVKNEAVSLCRGKYVLELDHDDEILPFVIQESVELFEKEHEIGFIYMDFINIYENNDNFWYGNNICKGYGSYYCQKYNNKWVYVYNTPNINNITLSHLVCCPNHPRIWRKDTLMNIGNFCEYLPICDDYEILLRTAINTKIAKIAKMGYIQYMNDNNNNFSLIRNAEINRIGPYFISPIYYEKFNIHQIMKEKDAYENEIYLTNISQIWKRDSLTYKHKYCNLLVCNDFDKQFCILGLDSILQNIENIATLYNNNRYDFLVLENKCTIEHLCERIDNLGFSKMKCFVLLDEPEENLINYFKLCYLSAKTYEIISTHK